MDHFNKVANEWDSAEKISLMKELATKVKNSVELEFDLEILDFGCGTGLFGLEFVDHAKRLVGMDSSQAMLDVFDLKTASISTINSVCVDLQESEFKDQFDLIISSMAFHHLKDPLNVLEKLVKLLKDKGQILIVDLDKEDGSFHPDNQGMGVKHYGFSKDELQMWQDKLNLKLEWKIINKILKNEREYNQFLAVYSK